MNGVASEEEAVRSGIAKRSVGPLLFVIFINDLPEIVVSPMFIFAEDTKLMKRVRSRKDSILLQRRTLDMDCMPKWSNTWLLNLYPDKWHILTLRKLRNIKQD